ncbi:phage major capsid protein [Azohydromonas sediminis]|uniref:phage major capsid protein n=1 Tax=Azohydromonas sediminis TaxID=2259674 RepID=UPI0013C2EEE1|nr:phage major capsid protein [Azohydromonas sediminis]
MNTTAHVGLTARQLDRYSLAELIAATARDDAKALGFYREVSDAVAARTGQQPSAFHSFFLPAEYTERYTRDMTAAGVSGSNFLVGQATGFAGALRAASITARLPLRRATLAANASVVVAATQPTSTWLSEETASIGDAAMAFSSRAATPKVVATTAFLSKQLDLQAPGAAAFIEAQAAAALAQAIDKAFVSGTGSNGEPTGLLALSGTTSQSGASIDYSGVATLIGAAEGYAGTPHVLLGKDTAKLLRQRPKTTGGTPIFDGGTVDGLPTIVSRAVPDNAMVVLDPTLVTEVQFGALEVVVAPLASPSAFRTGAIGIRLIAMVDFLVDHAAAVAVAANIT